MDKPIPAFYACYLLRSTIRHGSLYVGSTPNPVRRLRQHNGESKGGAVRTSKDSLRPWEMTCLVMGFPSKISALQFEWAWQNTHLTRHITPESRITQARATVRYSPKTGRVRKRPARPRLCLTDRLANLHLLLRASSFEKWPLKVTFYAEDVYRVWQKWTDSHPNKLREGINIVMDRSSRVLAAGQLHSNYQSTETAKGIHALDVGYSRLKPCLEKAKPLFAAAKPPRCEICSHSLPNDGSGGLLCPGPSCSMVSHIDCLAAKFLQIEDNKYALLPTTGHCPSCKSELQWVDLVKELSLRMRGGKEVTALFKPLRAGTKKTGASVAGEDETPMTELDGVSDEELPEEGEWNYLSESSDVEPASQQIESNSSPMRLRTAKRLKVSQPVVETDPVVEDSDWDEADVIS